MAAITVNNLPDAALPVLGTDKTIVTRDGTNVNDVTVDNLTALRKVTVQDEGTSLTTQVALINFTGAGVTATNTGDNVTVNIPGGGGGGSLTNFTEASNTAAPNATVPVNSLSATGAATNIDVAIVPKGNGGFSLQIPNNLASGGDKRGVNAVDLTLFRNSSSQVASGANSFSVGISNTASGAGSVTMGRNLSASGSDSTALGQASVASGVSSFAQGSFATTNGIQGQVAFGHNSNLLGGYQTTLTGLRQVTTGTTATRATADGATAATANQLTLRNNSVFIVEGSVVAYDLTTLDAASFSISALIKRGANAAATALVGTPVITRDFNDTAAATWAVTVVADTTNGAFGVNVQGAGANQIRWFVELYTQETGV